jgi:hypothetical protein
VAKETLRAAREYAKADDAYHDGAGPLGAVGLLGSGAGDRLDDARKALVEGDAAASLRASRAVEHRMDTAKRDGVLRLAAVGMALALILVGVWRFRRWRRHRGDRRVAKATAALDDPPTLAPLEPLSKSERDHPDIFRK